MHKDALSDARLAGEFREYDIAWMTPEGKVTNKVVNGSVIGSFGVDERTDGLWVVSHLPTGMSLASRNGVFRNADAAMKAVRELVKLCDWKTVTATTAEEDPELKHKVASLLGSFGGRSYYGAIA